MATLVRRYLKLIALVFLLGALADLVALGYPVILQKLVDGMSAKASWDLGNHILAAVLALALGGAAVSLLRDLLSVYLCGKFDVEASLLLVSKIVQLPLMLVRSRSTGEWLVAMQQIQELKLAVGMLGTQAIFDLLLILGYIGILAHYDPAAAAIYLVGVALTLAAMSALSHRVYEAFELGYERKARAETYLTEVLRNPLLVRAFQLGDWVKRRWLEPYGESVAELQKADYLSGVFGALFLVIRQGAPLLVLAWKLPDVSQGRLTFGAAFALSTVFGLGFDPLVKISAMISQLQKIRYGYHSTRDLLALRDEPQSQAREGRTAAGPLAVRLENVSFHHGLSGADLVVEAGTRVAIVGPSGSGKSTLLGLLAGLYRPTAGRVLFDGYPLEDIPLGVLRGWVGLVSQDNELFTGSILENIALGAKEPDADKARRCAASAGIAAFIESLPEGYDTWVGEGGSTLSAGQRQRIALARVIYRDARILLLDEPTSALDAVTERELEAQLPAISEGRTLVVAAHRLASIKGFDRIYVLSGGRAVECGTHDELLRRGGAYWRLWNARSEGGAAGIIDSAREFGGLA